MLPLKKYEDLLYEITVLSLFDVFFGKTSKKKAIGVVFQKNERGD
jgi:hypothetical protein